MKAWLPTQWRSAQDSAPLRGHPAGRSLTLLEAPRRTRGKPRRRRRRIKTRRRWTWRVLVEAPIPQLVALAVVLGGFYALATSHVFAIAQVQVGGAHLPAGLFRRSCRCVGANIFLAQPAAIRAAVSRIPWVDVRQVSAYLPDRLVIDATYRRPARLWHTTVATYTVDA